MILINYSKSAYKGPTVDVGDGVALSTLPFVVTIQTYATDHVTPYKHVCVGSIIHELYVLTAAHCFHENRNPKVYSIVGGNNKMFTNDNVKRYQAEKIIIHEDFYPLVGSDIALVKILNPFKLDGRNYDVINFVLKEEVRDNSISYVAGWGKIIRFLDKSLEWLQLKILNREKCKSKGFVYVSRTEICAVVTGHRGVCDVS